ncbi:MAG: hypothetical protein LAP40_23425 [Acidobacteriia bacterium]|nr:hypothetical protein [Terriglobia bacterium]
MFNTQASRLNDISNVGSQYDSMALNQQNTGSSLAEALLNMTMGSTNVGNTNSSGADLSTRI